jgi:UDP-3-O-[3-hydroxymyristoyl] glucosamine N-acyltransferase
MAAMCGVAGSTKIGEHCIFGGQCGVGGHITIADNTSVGGQSGVLGSVKKPGQSLFGTPAIAYMEFMRSYAMFKKAGKQ